MPLISLGTFKNQNWTRLAPLVPPGVLDCTSRASALCTALIRDLLIAWLVAAHIDRITLFLETGEQGSCGFLAFNKSQNIFILELQSKFVYFRNYFSKIYDIFSSRCTRCNLAHFTECRSIVSKMADSVQVKAHFSFYIAILTRKKDVFVYLNSSAFARIYQGNYYVC